MEKFNIICLSNQFFDSPLKTNKWHVMKRLAGLGHNVLFIDPPTRFRRFKSLIKGEVSFLHFLSGKKHHDKNLVVYTPVNLFNFKPFSSLNTWFHLFRAKTILKSFERRRTVLWIYHFDFPDLEDFVGGLKYQLMLYDVVDEYTAFPEYTHMSSTNTGLVRFIESLDDSLKIKRNQNGLSGKEWVIHRETWLAERADLIFASAPGLVLKFKDILKNLGKSDVNLHFVPNSGDYSLYKDSRKYKYELPKDLEAVPKPRIVFVGAIDSFKVDLSLVEYSASAKPDYSFIMIGPEKVSDPNLDLSKLKKMKNVYFLGQKAYELLPRYFAGADVYVIPYNLNDYTVGGCFPVKFHDALSAGLPVVVTNLPAYEPFRSVCYIAKNPVEYVEMIETALKEDNLEKVKARQEIAKENSWELKVENQVRLISNKLNAES